MSYQTKTELITVGAFNLQIRSLLNINQFSDNIIEDGGDSNQRITGTNWPLFGQIWPAGLVLAEFVSKLNLDGLRVLEVGCGLAIAGIIAHMKGADITVSDFNPEAADLLTANLLLNKLTPITFIDANWAEIDDTLGRFDLIIGSDLLYDREHPILLAKYLAGHLKLNGKFLLIDPGRKNVKSFVVLMATEGFDCIETSQEHLGAKHEGHRMQILNFHRSTAKSST